MKRTWPPWATASAPSPFLALVFGIAATLLLIASVGDFLLYDTVIRPGRLVQETRYLISNKRVLIQCGLEELHLDPARAVVATRGLSLRGETSRDGADGTAGTGGASGTWLPGHGRRR